MEITNVKTLWQEPEGFELWRKNIGNQSIFVHFLTPAFLFTKEGKEPVQPGDCIIFDRFSDQHFISPDNLLCHNWFHFTGDMSDIYNRYGFSPNLIYKNNDSAVITEIIQSIELETLRQNEFFNNIVLLKFEELIAKISRWNNGKSSPIIIKDEAYGAFKSLRQKIHSEYYRDWSAEDMADEVHLSLPVLYRRYKRLFGLTPRQDLINVRIEHSKSLLIQKSYSVEQIALMVGYSSSYHFIRQFKQKCGTTPAKYTDF